MQLVFRRIGVELFVLWETYHYNDVWYVVDDVMLLLVQWMNLILNYRAILIFVLILRLWMKWRFEKMMFVKTADSQNNHSNLNVLQNEMKQWNMCI